jgi:hypothetical protein
MKPQGLKVNRSELLTNCVALKMQADKFYEMSAKISFPSVLITSAKFALKPEGVYTNPG